MYQYTTLKTITPHLHTTRKALLLVVLLLFFSLPPTYSQSSSKYLFNTYQEDDGLPNELTKTIAQDTLGFIWIGTDVGLARFDGENYLHITEGLPSNYVKSLICRKNGQLIASTDLGLVEIISLPDTAYTRPFFQGSQNKTDSTLWYPKLLFEDSHDQLWVSDNVTVYRYDEGSFHSYPMGDECRPNHYHRSFSFFEDSFGGFYTISESGFLFRLNKTTDTFEKISQPFKPTTVHHALSLGKGKVAISTELGVYEYQFDQQGILLQQKKVEGLNDISYFAILDETNLLAASWSQKPFIAQKNDLNAYYQLNSFPFGNASFSLPTSQGIWVGTDNGVVLMQEKSFQQLFEQQSGGYIQQIIEGKNGKYYYSDGNNVYKITQTQGQWQSETIYTPTKGVIIRLLHSDRGLFMANNEGQIYLYHPTKALQTFDLAEYGGAIYILEEGKNGGIWFCQDKLQGVGRLSLNGTVKVFNKQEGFNSNIGVIKRVGNSLYFGGNKDDGYFFRFDDNTQSFINLSKPIPFDHHVDLEVFDIQSDKENGYWLSSSFGLLRLSKDTLERVNLGYFTDNAIKGAVLGLQNSLWIAHSSGIIKLNLSTKEMLFFDEKQGLPSKIIGFRNLVSDSKGRLWTATASGLAIAHNKPPVLTLPPTITKLGINAESVNIKSPPTIYTNDILNLSFVSSSHPTKFIEYQVLHVYEGETTSLPLHSSREVILGKLQQGPHIITLMAKQRGNYLWSNPTTFSFSVALPWYKKWWIWGLALLIIVYSIRIIIRWNTSKLKKEKSKLEAVIGERTKELVEKNKEIEAQHEELQQNQEGLQASLEQLKYTQGQLIQAEKMSSIGQLTAGIAHEINNPINFVYAGANTLSNLLEDLGKILEAYQQLEDNAENDDLRKDALEKLARLKEDLIFEELQPDINELMKDIQLGADRTAKIVRNLQNFSRTDDGVLAQAAIEEGIDSTLVLLSNKVHEGITIHKNYSNIPPINCMASQLNQVFMNIISNAIDAVEPSGDITIGTKNYADKIEVSISDTGYGMSEEVKSKLFDPFFTTKPIGKGTGLGMSVVYSIIEKHQGKIYVESEEGKGTTFYIELPKDLGLAS